MEELAFLVALCDTITLDEKHNAWKQLIKKYSDCSMERRTDMEEIRSMHEFLHKYMEIQEKSIERFFTKDNAIYRYVIKYKSKCKSNLRSCMEDSRMFSDIGICLSTMKNEIADTCDDENICEIYVIKEWLDWSGDYPKTIKLKMNLEMAILSVEESYLSNEENDIFRAFEGMWFSIPTPFKRGDIVKK